MKRSPFTHFLLLALAMLPLTICAQQSIQNKLLWRISGNGLTKPSWLYGTIHLTDKRVFNFGDSLYAALEACEGYAMEVDPDSMMTSMFKDGLENRGLLKKAVSAKDFERMKKKLQERLGRNPEVITVNESCEDEKIIHLGIAGPYPLKPAGLLTEVYATGLYWGKDYDAATIDADLKAYLKEIEQYDEQ